MLKLLNNQTHTFLSGLSDDIKPDLSIKNYVNTFTAWKSFSFQFESEIFYFGGLKVFTRADSFNRHMYVTKFLVLVVVINCITVLKNL